ncbi:hypothetical protein A8B84_16655 [Marinobacter sp. EhC06]|jgi:glycosyltransferase involved in cell wall biosynthesis|uniref:glycosyltransferase family 4 protein n=1 Tax=Marinobacter TaxID=2742 RepID=UPI0007D914F1|nr:MULTISPECIES: glycosyltransferase family 4 protein [unclassified Marinobacter]OAN92171.1 hypothetical protein A8B80_19715 [Marinobacter sp. EhN04]OAN96583.1 hypothetical protein A8B84_16655 [Marinobacter sp. EhC06]
MTLTVTHIASGDLWAGAEVQVFQLINALHESENIRATAILFNPGILADKLENVCVPVTVANESERSALQIIRSIRDHIRTNESDIIHTHGFKENILGVAGQRLAGVAPSVRTAHGNPEHTRSWRNPVKKLLDLSDTLTGQWLQQGVVAVSGQLKDVLEPCFPGKTHLIHNFVDIQALHREVQAGVLKKESNSFTIGLVGRMVPVKRVDLFLEAIGILSSDYGHPVRGVVIGDGPLRSQMEEKTRDLGLRNKISFAGFLNPALPAISGLDALLMPSDHEGLPMTLIEALGLEVPVVAHAIGGIPEVLGDSEYGTLVYDHSSRGYAEALHHLITHPEKARAKAVAGVRHIQAEFDKVKNVEAYISLYQSLVRPD